MPRELIETQKGCPRSDLHLHKLFFVKLLGCSSENGQLFSIHPTWAIHPLDFLLSVYTVSPWGHYISPKQASPTGMRFKSLWGHYISPKQASPAGMRFKSPWGHFNSEIQLPGIDHVLQGWLTVEANDKKRRVLAQCLYLPKAFKRGWV